VSTDEQHAATPEPEAPAEPTDLERSDGEVGVDGTDGVADADRTADAENRSPADDSAEGEGSGDSSEFEGTSDSEESDEADEAGDSEGSDDEADEAGDSEGSDDDGEDADDADGSDDADERPKGTAARLEREGEIAADFLERLLDIADLDGDLDVDVEGERASVAIVDSSEGRVPRRLVGQNGEVLEALQELTRLAVQARTGDRTRLMLDVAGHRARRREQLVARAQEAITQVRDSGEPLRLEAMNPFERKIVHDAVSAAGLSSSSDGVEPDRRIVVRPAG
jgi:spoIIIJ-associated protein